MVVADNLNLTGLKDWLNEEFKQKESGKKFTYSDCQQYIRLGKLPTYLGNYVIERKSEFIHLKIYCVIKKD